MPELRSSPATRRAAAASAAAAAAAADTAETAADGSAAGPRGSTEALPHASSSSSSSSGGGGGGNEDAAAATAGARTARQGERVSVQDDPRVDSDSAHMRDGRNGVPCVGAERECGRAGGGGGGDEVDGDEAGGDEGTCDGGDSGHKPMLAKDGRKDCTPQGAVENVSSAPGAAVETGADDDEPNDDHANNALLWPDVADSSEREDGAALDNRFDATQRDTPPATASGINNNGDKNDNSDDNNHHHRLSVPSDNDAESDRQNQQQTSSPLISEHMGNQNFFHDDEFKDVDADVHHEEPGIQCSGLPSSVAPDMPVVASPGDETDDITPSTNTTAGTEITPAFEAYPAATDRGTQAPDALVGNGPGARDEDTMAVRRSVLDAIVQHQAKRISELERRLDKKRAKIEMLSTNPAYLPGLSHLGLLQPHDMAPSQSAIVAAAAAHLQQQQRAVHPGMAHPSPYLAGSNPHLRAAAAVAASGSHMLGMPPCLPPVMTHAVHSSSHDAADRKQSRYWTADEHQRFLQAVKQCGPKNYVQISEIVGTRNAKQVRTHAQKFQKKLEREDAKRRATGSAADHAATVVAAASMAGGHASGLPAVAAAAAAAHAAMHGLDDSSSSDSGRSQYGDDITGMNGSSEGTSSSSDFVRDSDSAKRLHDPFTTPFSVPLQVPAVNDTTEAAAAAAVAAIAAEAVALGRRTAVLGPPLASNQQEPTPIPHSALDKSLEIPLSADNSGQSGSGSDKSGSMAAGDEDGNIELLRSTSDRPSSSFGPTTQKRPKVLDEAPSSVVPVDRSAQDSANGEIVPRAGQSSCGSTPHKIESLEVHSEDVVNGETEVARKVPAEASVHRQENSKEPPEQRQDRESQDEAHVVLDDERQSSAPEDSAPPRGNSAGNSAPNATEVKAKIVRA